MTMLETFIKPMHREGYRFVAIFAAIGVALAQTCTDPEKLAQARPRQKNQPGAERRKDVTVDQLPSGKIDGVIEEIV